MGDCTMLYKIAKRKPLKYSHDIKLLPFPLQIFGLVQPRVEREALL